MYLKCRKDNFLMKISPDSKAPFIKRMIQWFSKNSKAGESEEILPEQLRFLKSDIYINIYMQLYTITYIIFQYIYNYIPLKMSML